MSHKKFMEKFRETLSRKHNDVIEKDLKLEEMKEWINNRFEEKEDLGKPMVIKWQEPKEPTNKELYDRLTNIEKGIYSLHGRLKKFEKKRNKVANIKDVQAIIDILSDPLILRHRGYK